MNSEKIGKLIKELRVKNNLTQEKFAQSLNVTYQAVSKWENGKSLPDIDTLMLIAEKYNIPITEIIDGRKKSLKDKKLIIASLSLLAILLVAVGIYFLCKKDNNGFDFKTISTTCSEFNISGSAAYNKDNGFIYISDVSYCGKENTKTYSKISCLLYEKYEDNMTKISEYEEKENVVLSEYLKNVKLNINNYSSICQNMDNVNLILIIKATDSDNVVTTYDIPLTLEDNC